MSLETKIELLTAAVDKLTAIIENIETRAREIESQAQPEQATPVAPKVSPAKVKPKEVAPVAESVKPAEPTKPEAEAITVEQLQGMCLALCRKNPKHKLSIKTVLNNKLLKDVDPKEYANIKLCLEELGEEEVK